jgi:glucose-1-phosphate adenylyltransferase
MLTKNSVLGIIFGTTHDKTILALTKDRTMGSVPFGGKYRLIDFPLSNMANSAISEVGVVTQSNYQSLLDHIGSGREWDLARKSGGLHLLPPYASSGSGQFRGRLEALAGIWSFVENSRAEYVIMSDCDVVTTIDYRDVIETHIESDADITVVYAKTDKYDSKKNVEATLFELGDDGVVTDVLVNPDAEGEVNLGLNMFVMKKDFLRKIVRQSAVRNVFSFVKDVLQAYEENYKIIGFEHKGYFSKIDSMMSYYEAGMELLDVKNLRGLFKNSAPIYTKINDSGPVKYGIKSSVKNSLITDGSIIDGTVENSIIFRNVKIEAGAVVKNSIIMPFSVIEKNSVVNYVVADKHVVISEDSNVGGSCTYPLFIDKKAKV